jgi:hypothetical protein
MDAVHLGGPCCMEALGLLVQPSYDSFSSVRTIKDKLFLWA